jgi:membrane protein implicated in regulation of membrane protease activity
LFLETEGQGRERVAETLFLVGIGAFLLAAGADGAVHLAGWHQLELAAHLAVFAGMALASVALVVRGLMPRRKERSHAVR